MDPRRHECFVQWTASSQQHQSRREPARRASRRREHPPHVEWDIASDIVILHDRHNQPFLNPARRSPVTM